MESPDNLDETINAPTKLLLTIHYFLQTYQTHQSNTVTLNSLTPSLINEQTINVPLSLPSFFIFLSCCFDYFRIFIEVIFESPYFKIWFWNLLQTQYTMICINNNSDLFARYNNQTPGNQQNALYASYTAYVYACASPEVW